MKQVSAAACRHILTALIKWSWAVQASGERKQARGEHVDAWAHNLAVRWRCVDDVPATITSDALSSR